MHLDYISVRLLALSQFLIVVSDPQVKLVICWLHCAIVPENPVGFLVQINSSLTYPL